MQNFRRYTILVIAVLYLISCNNSIKYPEGGYDYPKHVADKDTNFYYYPVRDSFSKQDSVKYATAYAYYQAFNEPNLSLKPLVCNEFRLYYDLALGYTYIITLTEKEILIKKSKSKMYYDNEKLSNLEKLHYRILYRYYPFNYKEIEIPKYVDSLLKASPQISNPIFYKSLLTKMINVTDSPFTYTTKKITIQKNDFAHLVTKINSLGYWEMPCVITCGFPPNDGAGYFLEANTSKKYNLVSTILCPENNDVLYVSFAKACQEIINYAHLEKEIHTWSDNKIDTAKSVIVQDVQLEDIKQPPPKNKKKKNHLPNKEQKVQGSDTTKLN